MQKLIYCLWVQGPYVNITMRSAKRQRLNNEEKNEKNTVFEKNVQCLGLIKKLFADAKEDPSDAKDRLIRGCLPELKTKYEMFETVDVKQHVHLGDVRLEEGFPQRGV